MDQQLSAENQELYRRVDEVLHYLWDPIGISDIPQARDEYYSYLPSVFALLTSGADVHELAAYLTMIVTQRMGLSDVESGQAHSRKIATALQAWRDFIHARYAK